jgi:hypothetical protein
LIYEAAKGEIMSAHDEQAHRVARNEAVLREVNERIEELLDDAAHPEFFCECGEGRCVETIEVSIAEYTAVRSSPLRFVVRPGHELPEFERVVEETNRYRVVEKVGDAGEVARELDSRS